MVSIGRDGGVFSHIGWRQLFAAQRGHCFYCGQFLHRQHWTRDHLFPKSRGWRTLPLNQVLCCAGCNQKKGARLPTERELAKARVVYVKAGGPAFAF